MKNGKFLNITATGIFICSYARLRIFIIATGPLIFTDGIQRAF
jgi:hypothetical protein